MTLPRKPCAGRGKAYGTELVNTLIFRVVSLNSGVALPGGYCAQKMRTVHSVRIQLPQDSGVGRLVWLKPGCALQTPGHACVVLHEGSSPRRVRFAGLRVPRFLRPLLIALPWPWALAHRRPRPSQRCPGEAAAALG